MINLNAVANEVFQILRSFDYTVMMYDDEGMQVYEPEDARRMFAKPENLLVSIVEDNDNSRINLYLSGDTDAESVLGLITALRTAANKYNMIFDDQKWDRDLTVKDFSTKHSVRESKSMELTEGMYGTSRSSYLKLENARMIVRHSAKIDENIAGARSRKVESIFVETAQGERFLFPTKQLAPARAMTQHMNHGGGFADEVGQQITQMATDYAALGQASSFIGMNEPVLAEGAGELRQKVRESRKGLRKCFERLYREGSYAGTAETLREQASNPILAEDATVERLREMLTIEGKELDETIISAVARCVESATPVLDEAEVAVAGQAPDATPPAADASAAGDTINVLGHRVERAAWDKFKAGKLVLRASPESIIGQGPDARDPNALIMFKFENIIPLIVTNTGDKAEQAAGDGLVNFFSAIVDEYEGAVQKKKEGILTIAKHALEFANVRISEGLGFRGSKVIREFEEWFDSMGSKSVLGDHEIDEVDAPMGADLGDIGADLAPEMPGQDFGAELPGEEIYNPEPDMSPLGSSMGAGLDMGAPMGDQGDFNDDDDSMAADIANGYTEGSNWRLNFPEKDQAAEVIGEKTALIQISNSVLGGSRNGSVHSDPAEGPRQSFEWSIEDSISVSSVPAAAPAAPMVPPAHAPMGLGAAPAPMGAPVDPMADPMADPMGDPMMGADMSDPMGGDMGDSMDPMMGEGELTREDILLPRDQEMDLKQEVGHDIGSSDEFEHGEGEKGDLTMERLRKLSGIRIAD